MNVGELIQLLKHQPKDMEVRITYPYGDRAMRVCAPEITAVDKAHIQYSDYTQESVVMSPSDLEDHKVLYDDGDAGEYEPREVVCLYCAESEDLT